MPLSHTPSPSHTHTPLPLTHTHTVETVSCCPLCTSVHILARWVCEWRLLYGLSTGPHTEGVNVILSRCCGTSLAGCWSGAKTLTWGGGCVTNSVITVHIHTSSLFTSCHGGICISLTCDLWQLTKHYCSTTIHKVSNKPNRPHALKLPGVCINTLLSCKGQMSGWQRSPGCMWCVCIGIQWRKVMENKQSFCSIP